MNTIRCDRELVQAGLEGDLGAFEKLVERYQDVLYRHALCYVHRREEAQDIVQEAFLKAFQELPSLNDPAKFGGWMRSAIRNSCLNLMRSNRRRTAVREEIERGRVEEKPDAPWIEGIEMASVRELLSRLPEENANTAWLRLAQYQRSHGVLERDVKVVDLRLPDRLIVRKSPVIEGIELGAGQET